MEILIESFLEDILQIVVAVIGAAVAAGTAVFVRWITRKTKNDTLGEYVGMLAFYAEQAVNEIAQTQAELLKEAAADGKLTAEEKAAMKKAALDNLKAIAPDAMLKFMERANSDIDVLLSTLIESAVKDSNGGES